MPVIVQINTQADPRTAVGGIMHAIGRRCAAEGFDSHIVAGYGWRAHSDLVLEGKARYVAYALRHRRFGDDGFIEGEPTRRLLRYLDKVRPDIVHLHNMHGYYLDMPALTAWLLRTGTRTVATLHDLWWLTGRCASPGDCPVAVDGRSGCEDCRFPQYYPAVSRKVGPRYKAEYISPLNAGIVVPSEAMADIVRRSILSHLPLTVIGNGTDKTVFMPEGPNIKLRGDVKILAVSANWNPLKNSAALQRLAKAMPEGWHLTVVGGDSGVKGKNVSLWPVVKRRDTLAALYRDADVLLSPSLSESFGMTVSEANACGTPAVVNSEAVPAIRPVKGNILSAPFSDTDAVIAAVRRAVDTHVDPRLVRSTDDMSADHMNLYRQIIANK